MGHDPDLPLPCQGKERRAAAEPTDADFNFVWNFYDETQEASRRHNKRWPTGFDLINVTGGSSRELGLHSDTVQAVCKEFAARRDKIHRRPRWRGKKSLEWVPFQASRAIKLDGDATLLRDRLAECLEVG